jgi:subtilisin family serine protease
MSKIKRVISVLLTMVLLISATPFVVAENVFRDEICFSLYSRSDERILSMATLDDDFCDNSIVVIYTVSASKNNRDITTGDFRDIGAVAVEDIVRLSERENVYAQELWRTEREWQISRNSEAMQEYAQAMDLAEENTLVNFAQFRRVIIVRLDKNCKENVLQVVRRLERIDGILSVEPNFIEQPTATNPNDPRFRDGSQWALERISAAQAWGITTGSANIRVGIIDTGIANHNDLDNNVNRALGWDFVNNNDNTADDPNGHGTNSAGIVGAVGNNGIGITGINQTITLVPLQVVTATGGFDVAAVTSSIWHSINIDVSVLNYSGGGTNASTARQEAIRAFRGVFVASAGNSGNNNDDPTVRVFPASYDIANVISVGASLQNDERAVGRTWGSSNFGANSVHLFAPTETLTTHLSDGYFVYGGTSAAAPHVSGVAALLMNRFPNATTQQVKWAILEGADRGSRLVTHGTLTNGLNGLSITGGRLNAYGAMRAMQNLQNANNHDMTYGVHHIRNFGSRRYLDSAPAIYTGVPIETSQLLTPSRIDDEFQQWIIQRRDDLFEIRSVAALRGSANVARLDSNGNSPLMRATSLTSTTLPNIRVVRNLNDGTVTFRLGTATNALVLTESGNRVTWSAHTGANTQRWVLEPHRLTHQRGDVNRANGIDTNDRTRVTNHVANPGASSFNALDFFLADVNRDGRVNNDDVVEINRFLNRQASVLDGFVPLIQDGTYIIRNRWSPANTPFNLEVRGTGTPAANTIVQVGTSTQRWIVRNEPNGMVSLTPTHATNMRLNSSAAVASTSTVQQNNNTSVTQRFRIRQNASAGFFNILPSQDMGNALNIDFQTTGTPIVSRELNEGWWSQQWEFIRVS